MSYEEYLNKISKSKDIVDWVNRNQTGLTRRPYETIFFKKKLITNMKNIKEYDIYDSNNIFIVGEDDIHSLHKFIETPFNPLDSKILENYTFENWINTF